MRHYYATNAGLRHYYGPAEIHFAVGECSLGSILVAQSAKGVCAILLGDDPDSLVRDLQDRSRARGSLAEMLRSSSSAGKVIGWSSRLHEGCWNHFSGYRWGVERNRSLLKGRARHELRNQDKTDRRREYRHARGWLRLD